VLVEDDCQQLVPDHLAGLVVGCSGVRCVEGDGPVVGIDPDLGPRGRHLHPLGGRVLVEPHRGVGCRHEPRRRLQPRYLRVVLGLRGGALRHEVAQDARLHALLPEAWEDVSDVGEIRLVRADEQNPAPAVTEAGVGVEKVRGAVQGDDGLPRARTAVDDEDAS
jgi:hypothetical protein